MPRYSQEKIDEVRQATDLAELAAHYTALKRAGAVYSALCPFHAEKTPSFKIDPRLNRFYCFGCHTGGDAFHFLMKMENLSFPEAVEELARRAGVELPAAADRVAAPDGISRSALYEALQQAQKFYAGRLWAEEGAAARRYLAERGLDRRTAEDFGLGLAPAGWDALRRHLQGLGFGEQAAVQAGLIRPGRENGHFYDFFRDRLMVPISDAQNRVVAFGGRLLPGAEEGRGGKYINTGGTPLYTKGRLLFGLHRARPFIRAAGLTYLVEGYFDLISLAAAGVKEVVAALGTALTERQIKLLQGLTGRVLLLFDGDPAGREVPIKNLPAFLNADLEARVVSLPAGHDPDSFIRAFGAEALAELSAGAADIFEYWVERLKQTSPDSGGLPTQFQRLNTARALLAQLPDPAKRQLVRRRLADLLGVADSALAGASGPPSFHPPAEPAPAAAEPALPSMDGTALALLTFILTHPEAAGPVLSLGAAWWPDDPSRLLFDRLKAAFEAAGSLSPAAVQIDGLPAALGSLAARAIFEPRTLPPSQAEAAARNYLERLKTKWRRRRQGELSAAIARAQAAGDEAEIRRLQEEKKSLLNL